MRACGFVDSGFATGGLAVDNKNRVIHRARLCAQAPQASQPEKDLLQRVGNFQFPQLGKIEFLLTEPC
jgi:hypothetical protein